MLRIERRRQRIVDEIAGETDQIGAQRVGAGDDVSKHRRVGEFSDVNVAEMCDRQPVECRGQIAQCDGDGADAKVVELSHRVRHRADGQ